MSEMAVSCLTLKLVTDSGILAVPWVRSRVIYVYPGQRVLYGE